jgi:hypothetical protein
MDRAEDTGFGPLGESPVRGRDADPELGWQMPPCAATGQNVHNRGEHGPLVQRRGPTALGSQIEFGHKRFGRLAEPNGPTRELRPTQSDACRRRAAAKRQSVLRTNSSGRGRAILRLFRPARKVGAAGVKPVAYDRPSCPTTETSDLRIGSPGWSLSLRESPVRCCVPRSHCFR